MAARRNRNRHRRRRGRFGVLYKLLSCLIILVALLIGCVAFFRVNQITVVGAGRYSTQEVIEASGVKMGDNLFLINRPQTALNIHRRLPYVETAAAVPRLPDTLELRITETSAVAVIQGEEGWWLIDAGGKLLETGDRSIGTGLPVVLGLSPSTPTLGMPMAAELEDQPRLESLTALLTALNRRGMATHIAGFIDLTSASTIRFGYGEALTVALPMTGDFDRLALAVQRTVETFQQGGEPITGTLDITYGDEQARLLTEQWLPEKY